MTNNTNAAGKRLPGWLWPLLALLILAAAALCVYLRPRPLAPEGLNRISISAYQESWDETETLGSIVLSAGEPGFDAVSAALEGQTWRQPFPGSEQYAHPIAADSSWRTLHLALTDDSGNTTWIILYDDGYLQVMDASRGFAAGEYSALAAALYDAAESYLYNE